MSSYNHFCNRDYRNEGWTFNGSGVSHCFDAWSNDDDTKYCSSPPYKGRACVQFPIDVSAANIPDGAVIGSITIFIRVKKTSGRSVTVNILSTDNTAKYTSRTIYPTSTITNFEVGTYITDPQGRSWTKDTLNKLMAQVFSYLGVSDGIRVYKLWAQVNYSVRPTVSVQNPTGTVNSPSPAVSWTYAQVDGNPQKSAEYKIFTSTQQETSTFNPDTTTATYSGSVSGDITSFNLPTALTPNAYYIYVRVTSSFNSKSIWVGRAFTVQGAAPGVPGGGFGGIGTGSGGGFESVIADAVTSNAYLTIRDGSNLLSVQQADFETTTDSLGYTTTNCSIAQDTTQFFNLGAGSMKLTASSLGTMSAQSSFIEVAQSTPITARAQFKAAVTSRTVNVSILFYDETYSFTNAISGTGTDLTTTWTEVSCTGTTPSDAVYAVVQLQVVTAANASVHYVDGVGLMYGTNSVWSHGGHASRNLLSSAASDGDDPVTVEAWAAAPASAYTRVSSTGVGSEGSKQFKMTYVGLSPSIAFVATGSAFTDTSTGTGYTLNKPAGLADGDLMVAYVSSDTGSTAIPPTGWVVVDDVQNTGTSASGLTVLMRDGLAADPSTWASNFNLSATRKRAIVVAYRGAAGTATQLAAENVSKSTSGGLVPQTPALTNTDPNAWRLSAFTVRDDASGGTMIANIAPPSVVPPISYVGKSGNWWYGGALGTYTINRPSNVVSGDLMIAHVASSGNNAVYATPSGWTLVRRTTKSTGDGTDHSGSIVMTTFQRTAGSSEPSSWSSTYTGYGTPVMSQAVAYRNCEIASNQFIAETGSSNSGSYSLQSGSVTNTDSKAWRVTAFAFTCPTGDHMTSDETIERSDDTTDVGNHPDVVIGTYDSNGPVSTGTYSRQGITDTSNPWTMASWIGILKPLATPPAPGGNETERADATAGASTPWLTLAAYDSNGVAATGSTTIYGQFTPGSGTTVNSTCGWIGYLTPGAAIVAGEVGATTADYVDISSIDSAVFDRANGKITYQAAFLGSTGGTPYLKLFFYTGNELISTKVSQGQSFGTSTWAKSIATFDIPAGTTRIKAGVTASDRAVNDIVYFDRVSVALGTGTVWRRGTGRPTHPIYNVPLLEYAEDRGDGYGDWAVLPGSERALLQYDQLTGLVTFIDQTLVPLASRKYRARTISYGLAGDIFVSAYGPESDEISLAAQEWWLKDPLDPTRSMQLKIKAEPLDVSTSNTSAVFQPLGEQRPVVLTEGYKGDTVAVTAIVDRIQYAQLRALLNSGRTLYLQSNMDNAWWVRPVGDMPSQTQLTGKRGTDPLRFVRLMFTEVASDL